MARKPTSKAEDFRVAYVPLASLKPYPRNARKHNQRQIRLLAESIKEFGWTLPVLIDAENMILAGHGRVEAAKLLGMEAVPSLRIERLNESQKRAYVIADNRLAERTGWDEDILSQEMQVLSKMDLNFDLEKPKTKAGRERISAAQKMRWARFRSQAGCSEV